MGISEFISKYLGSPVNEVAKTENKTIIPDERLRVFISSAQNNENGFAWSDVRRRIKDYLKECVYLNPFIIEDVSSSVPSIQFFQQQVERADIVVLLVKGELRKGTAIEYALTTKLKKPLLVYFLEDETPSLSVTQLINDLQTNDYCTYHQMKSFDGIEYEIRNEVIQDVIRYYQRIPSHRVASESITDVLSIEENIEPSKLSVPNKTALEMFKSSYNHIYKLLEINYYKKENIEKESLLHSLGVATLNWLIKGENLNCDAEILALIECASDLYESTEWLQSRWDAIRYAIADEIEKALESEKQALELAEKAKLPKWIINDILIDYRNIEQEVNRQKHLVVYENIPQNNLNKSDTIVYLPVLDRYLGNVFDEVTKEEFRIKTASPWTTFYGGNFTTVISNIENYFFSALLYGSYTHMVFARKTLANMLYKYADLSEDNALFISCIKLLLLNGNKKECQQIIQHQWDNIYSGITSCADDVWRLTDNTISVYQSSIKLFVITKLGLYFSDEVFVEIEKFLLEYSKTVRWGNSDEYFDCIYQNIARISSSKIISMLIEILKEKRFHIGNKVSNIILHLKLDEVAVDQQIAFCEALVGSLGYIVEQNGTPQIIAVLEKQNPEVFSKLSTIPENGLIGIEKIFYDINMGKGNWTSVLLTEIDTAKKQFEANNTSEGVYLGFAEQPYAMIKKVLREHYNASMDEIIDQKLFPLFIDVLNSNVAIKVKDDCISCLCDTLIFTTNQISIPQELIDAISKISTTNIHGFWGETNRTFACRVLMLRILIGIAKKDELLEWCVGYNKKSTEEKIVLAECIEQYLQYANFSSQDMDITLLSITLQCLEDDYYLVRKKACDCLNYFINTKYHDLAEQKLYAAAVDPSHFVRDHLLFLCKEGKLIDRTIADRIKDILKNDANFGIRCFID